MPIIGSRNSWSLTADDEDAADWTLCSWFERERGLAGMASTRTLGADGGKAANVLGDEERTPCQRCALFGLVVSKQVLRLRRRRRQYSPSSNHHHRTYLGKRRVLYVGSCFRIQLRSLTWTAWGSVMFSSASDSSIVHVPSGLRCECFSFPVTLHRRYYTTSFSVVLCNEADGDAVRSCSTLKVGTSRQHLRVSGSNSSASIFLINALPSERLENRASLIHARSRCCLHVTNVSSPRHKPRFVSASASRHSHCNPTRLFVLSLSL